VTNPVEKVRPEDVPHLFERFWRKDAARSGGEHAGLGLSLARAFANSLGFTLSAAFEGDGQLRTTLSGPAGAEHSPNTILTEKEKRPQKAQ
jgi:signal transduction histidine kinase